ncbi:MAG: NADH-quinone oxidoreductase subunit K [Planctomycetes bacterium]|nr:NADH-quinone oxidoreductase subunit K [Planctomycetota bacterium]
MLSLATPLLVGVLGACGLLLLMRRRLLELVLGVALLGHAANLMLLGAARDLPDPAPLVAPGELLPPAGHADPVPQALVLTAIVIGLGVQAFVLALVRRQAQLRGDDLVDPPATGDVP